MQLAYLIYKKLTYKLYYYFFKYILSRRNEKFSFCAYENSTNTAKGSFTNRVRRTSIPFYCTLIGAMYISGEVMYLHSEHSSMWVLQQFMWWQQLRGGYVFRY